MVHVLSLCFFLLNSPTDALLPPLLVQTSYPSESHYYPITHSPPHPLLLHAHSSAPYIPDFHPIQSHGLNLTLYSSASSKCLTGITLQIDWWSTFGRWGSRYMMTILSWAVGVISSILAEVWRQGASSSKFMQYFHDGAIADGYLIKTSQQFHNRSGHLYPTGLSKH